MSPLPSGALSAGAQALGVRLDPNMAFAFHVEIEGLLVASFSEVSGLQLETSVEDYREGGRNDRVHKLPGPVSYPNLTLKRGLTGVGELWSWHQEVVAGTIERKNVTIYLLDPRLRPVTWWDVHDAYPVKWQGPELKADSASVAFETVELAHAGITRTGSAGAAAVASAGGGALGRLL